MGAAGGLLVVLTAAAELAAGFAVAGPATVSKTALITIEASIEIAAPGGKVWTVLTDAEKAAGWCLYWTGGTGKDALASVGRTVAFHDEYGNSGRSVVLYADPARELRVAHVPDNGSYLCETKFTLTPKGSSTRLRMIEQHSDPPDPGQTQKGANMEKMDSFVKKMAKAMVKPFEKPDEVREFPKGRLELVQMGGATVGRATLQPGWRWQTSLQPIVKTKSCEAPHFQYHVSGVLRVRMDDGTEFDCRAGDVSLVPPGHDAWVVGKDPVVIIDFQGMLDYARPK